MVCIFVGYPDDDMEGVIVESVGIFVGAVVGCFDGVFEGYIVCDVGCCDGDIDALIDGTLAGVLEGAILRKCNGKIVSVDGAMVGTLVG